MHRHNFDNYLNAMASLGYKNYYQVLNAKDYGIPQNRERVFTISIRNDIDKEFTFPPKQELHLRLKDMLEDEVDQKYYLSDKMINYCLGVNQKQSGFPRGERFLQNINRNNQDVAVAISTNAGNRPVDNFVKIKDGEMTQEPFIKIKNATIQGYQEAYEGDSVNLSYPNSNTRRGRVGNQVAQTLQCNDSMGVVENTRIRKLTPRECFKLMGFTDEEFEKASQGTSNTQLYKMARKFDLRSSIRKYF